MKSATAPASACSHRSSVRGADSTSSFPRSSELTSPRPGPPGRGDKHASASSRRRNRQGPPAEDERRASQQPCDGGVGMSAVTESAPRLPLSDGHSGDASLETVRWATCFVIAAALHGMVAYCLLEQLSKTAAD